MALAGVSHRKVDELRGQFLEPLTIGNGLRQLRGLLGRDAPADVTTILPDLMLVVGTNSIGLPADGTSSVFSLETAFLHGWERSHLVDELSALGEKISIHSPTMSID